MALELLGENHFTTANNYFHYSRTLTALGDYREAKIAGKKALDIGENLLGEEHSFTVTCVENLINIYSKTGESAKVEEYQRMLVSGN